MSSDLQISDHPSIREALQKDEANILDLLKGILTSETERTTVLCLRGVAAQKFVNLVQDILDRGPLRNCDDGSFCHDAHRLLVKLSEVSNILPSGLSVKGVTLLEKHPKFGGGFVDIFRASYRGNEVALKRMRVFQRGDELQSINRRFCREALLWQQLQHPFVIPFLGIDSKTFPSFSCMVLPWMQHGTIIKHLADTGNLNVDTRIFEVAQGLEYLHSQHIVHGDLRGSNILINDAWHAVLADFGLAVFVDATANTSHRSGSTRWMAPELSDPESFELRQSRRTPASDVYAFACACLEIYTGCPPFSDSKSDFQVIMQVAQGVRPERPCDPGRVMPDYVWTVVESCWVLSDPLVNYNPTPRAVPKDNMRFSLPYCSPLVDKTFVVVPIPVDQQLKEHKGKYEQAKTELRNVKGTSLLSPQGPKLDKSEDLDQLPLSPDGGVLDIHIKTFISAIDTLLTVGRSNSPTQVLAPTKSVVNAVFNIVEDVRSFERRPQRDYSDIDLDALRALRKRAEATLGNLVTASKRHATSSGRSPVSLLDAAASHVSTIVTEIGKVILIRKATMAEQEQSSYTPNTLASANDGLSLSLRSVNEVKASYQRKASGASSSSRRGMRSSRLAKATPALSLPRRLTDSRARPPSENSSSDSTDSPHPIFDHGPSNSGDSAVTDGSEDACWAELKPYLEAQTESIVYAIQGVLSGVRSPTPSPTLNENLIQIITIVSCIVAVCIDNIPPASSQQGNGILRELSEHANKLSEVLALPVTKESRQIMAKSSFAVANAMKGLLKL